jgi:hypothetical protein
MLYMGSGHDTATFIGGIRTPYEALAHAVRRRDTLRDALGNSSHRGNIEVVDLADSVIPEERCQAALRVALREEAADIKASGETAVAPDTPQKLREENERLKRTVGRLRAAATMRHHVISALWGMLAGMRVQLGGPRDVTLQVELRDGSSATVRPMAKGTRIKVERVEEGR